MIGWVIVGAGALFLAWMGGSYMSEQGVREPAYRLESERNGYEIRVYEPYLVAEAELPPGTEEPLSAGFRMLFAYITGANSGKRKIPMTAPVLREQEGEKIPMTAPVLRESSGGGSLVAFVLPPDVTPETAPLPDNRSIRFREIPGRRVAVIRFPGYANDRIMAEKREELARLLEKDGVQRAGDFVEAYYNPPWTPPFMRRNEVMTAIR